jgi:hypothetical protein
MDLGFDKQAYVLKDLDPTLYNSLLFKQIDSNDEPQYVLRKKTPTKDELTSNLVTGALGSAAPGGFAGYLGAKALRPIVDNNANIINPKKYSGRIGALLGAALFGGAGYAHSKKKNKDYKKLTKDQKLNQIKSFITARKNDEYLTPYISPVQRAAMAAHGAAALATAARLGQAFSRISKNVNAGKSSTSGTGANERFTGSGNQGGGGKSDYHNPYTGEKADKYDKFMAMKRMAAEGETEGLRNNASAAVEKWKKKYKFASMLKISRLLK